MSEGLRRATSVTCHPFTILLPNTSLGSLLHDTLNVLVALDEQLLNFAELEFSFANPFFTGVKTNEALCFVAVDSESLSLDSVG